MYYFADGLVLCCLFTSGFFFGYYCNFSYVYNNLWIHWYAALGMLVALLLAGIWMMRKYKARQYRFDHFYVILYGLICFVISACLMLTDNLEIGFYFGFIGLGTIYIPCYSFISLRSNSQGNRPARVALGNALYFAGFTTGFSLFNEFEPTRCGWIFMGITLLMIAGAVVNELLQHCGLHNYKQSCDLVFNLMNDEKIIFLPTKSVYALFVGRPEFFITRNRQWLVVALAAVVVLERLFLYSSTFLQLTWSSTFAYMITQYLYGPFFLYSIGCLLGACLMVRYKPKLLYMLFGLIKNTFIAAILVIYSEESTENCFFFLCFYYISIGVYSSIALQMVLECTPFLFTELVASLAFAVELLAFEMFKYETNAESTLMSLLVVGIISLLVTVAAIVIIQMFLPRSAGLIDIRNKLLGIRRHRPVVPQTKMWNANYFLHQELQPHELSSVKLEGNRVFQQYPAREVEKKNIFFWRQ